MAGCWSVSRGSRDLEDRDRRGRLPGASRGPITLRRSGPPDSARPPRASPGPASGSGSPHRQPPRRVRRRYGIAAKTKRKFRSTTDPNHDRPLAENLVGRQFEPRAADITSIPTREGRLYLSAVEDLHTRRIVGWSMSEQIDSRLLVDAMEMAITRRLHGAGLVAHSDRGSQYASEHDQRIPAGHGISCLVPLADAADDCHAAGAASVSADRQPTSSSGRGRRGPLTRGRPTPRYGGGGSNRSASGCRLLTRVSRSRCRWQERDLVRPAGAVADEDEGPPLAADQQESQQPARRRGRPPGPASSRSRSGTSSRGSSA